MFQLRPDKPKDPEEVDKDIEEMAKTIRAANRSKIPTDVMGSYTGTPRDGEVPTQDADDL
jgi:hypothetical protein